MDVRPKKKALNTSLSAGCTEKPELVHVLKMSDIAESRGSGARIRVAALSVGPAG